MSQISKLPRITPRHPIGDLRSQILGILSGVTLFQQFKKQAQGDGLKARLIRGGLGSAGIQATSRMTALALSIVLARMLGPEGYGIYAYAFAIMSLLMIVAEAGVPTLLMREVASSQSQKEWGPLRGIVRRGAQYVALVAFMVSLLGQLGLWWVADSLQRELLYTTALMLCVLPLAALTKAASYAMRGLHKVVVGQTVEILIRPLVTLIIIAALFMIWPDYRQPYVPMAGQLLGALISLLTGALALRFFLPREGLPFRRQYKDRQWFKSTLPFMLIGGAAIINNQADIIMVGWYLGAENVGIYRVAAQAAILVAFGLQVVVVVVAPQFAKLYAKNQFSQLRRLLVSSTKIIIAVTVPPALLLIVFGEILVAWVFGGNFVDAYLPLLVLVLSQIVNALVGPMGVLLNMMGHENINSKLIAYSALLNITLNIIFIPFFGIVGAAVATGISVVCKNVAQYIFGMRALSAAQARV